MAMARLRNYVYEYHNKSKKMKLLFERLIKVED
jgi:hypothetical protein